ncbi:hypothetical protein FB645_004776 [Coemansia sp. IMI 203386]|nr:hypothetical protein FB645_004776 [Coemansia sp. IMI 203386]
MIVNYPMWLYIVASIVPATQGMLNLLVFLNNPVFDRQRREMAGKWIKSFYRKRQQSSSTISDTIGNTSASSISISFDDSSHFDEAELSSDPRNRSVFLHAKQIYGVVREQVKLNYGDLGLGHITSGFQGN